MTNYSRGASFERTVKADLKARNFLVIRAAGSHGIVDLVAFPPMEGTIVREPWFIQAKTNGIMSPAERFELYECAASHGAWAVRASRPTRGTIRYERLFTHGKTQWVELHLPKEVKCHPTS